MHGLHVLSTVQHSMVLVSFLGDNIKLWSLMFSLILFEDNFV